MNSVDVEYQKNLLWWHHVDGDLIHEAVHSDAELDLDLEFDLNGYDHIVQYCRNPCVPGIPGYVRDFCRDVFSTYPQLSLRSAARLWALRSSVCTR